jgi:hypothetical protein
VGIFVYYNDGYYNDGDVGLNRFDSNEEAEDFILKRLKTVDSSRKRSLDDYIVIEGEYCDAIEAEKVTCIKIKRR